MANPLKTCLNFRNGLTLATLLCMGSAEAAMLSFQLGSHPDGNQNPPPYGLRLDGLFTGNGGDVWSFDFNRSGSDGSSGPDMTLTFDDVANKVTIAGTTYGGLDVNSVYDGTLQGLWDVSFMYQANVTSLSPGPGLLEITVTAENALNMGTITPLFSAMDGGIDITSGDSIALVDKQSNDGFSFKFNNTDNHRLAGHGLSGPETYVGRGWLTHSGGQHISASDWLFVGTVPIPAAIWLFASGLVGLGAIARRRKTDLLNNRPTDPSIWPKGQEGL